jgi:DNA repair protein RadC
MSELQQQPGIGASTAARIKAAFELGRRLLIERPSDRPQIRTPADAANLVMAEMGLLEQEHLRTILLDTKNRVVDIPTIYVGSVNTTMIRVAEVFREAIRRNCPSLIVLHNHPSGDVSPSPEDVAVTRQIVEAGKLMDVDVLDHLIVSRTVFVSLKERGLGF